MTIRHLKIFIAVYDHLSITHAAQALHLTQPVVTRTIKELEHYYGAQLFERMNRRLYVTDAGKHFYAHARKVINSFDCMEENMRNAGNYSALSIGSTLTLGSFLLPRIIQRLQNLYPNTVIRAQVTNAEHLHHALYDNQLDFALIEDHIDHPILNSKPLFQDRLVLLLPKDHPLLQKETINMHDLRNERFLLQEKGCISRQLFDDAFARHGITINPLLESRSVQAIIQSVSMGLGLALLPEHFVKSCINDGLFTHRTIADESFSRQNYIVWHKNKLLSEPIAQAMDVCYNTACALQTSHSSHIFAAP